MQHSCTRADNSETHDLVIAKVVDGTLQYDTLSGYHRYVNERNVETRLRRHP